MTEQDRQHIKEQRRRARGRAIIRFYVCNEGEIGSSNERWDVSVILRDYDGSDLKLPLYSTKKEPGQSLPDSVCSEIIALFVGSDPQDILRKPLADGKPLPSRDDQYL